MVTPGTPKAVAGSGVAAVVSTLVAAPAGVPTAAAGSSRPSAAPAQGRPRLPGEHPRRSRSGLVGGRRPAAWPRRRACARRRTSVGATWRGGREPIPRVRVRSRTDGRWGDWRHRGCSPTCPTQAPRAFPVAGDRAALGRPGRGRAGARPPRATPAQAGADRPGQRAGDWSASASASPAARPVLRARAASAGAPCPDLLGRRARAADESWRTKEPYQIRWSGRSTHHAVTANDYCRRDVAGLVCGMYRYHTASLAGPTSATTSSSTGSGAAGWVARAGLPGGSAGRTRQGSTTPRPASAIGNSEDAAPDNRGDQRDRAAGGLEADREGGVPSGTVRVRLQGSDLTRRHGDQRLPVNRRTPGHQPDRAPRRLLHDWLPVIRRRMQRRVDRF